MGAPVERYVIHLPVTAPDLPGALRLARVLARWARILPQTDPGESTVSAEDAQGVRHRVFCDRPLAGTDRRCLLRDGHDGPCTRRIRG